MGGGDDYYINIINKETNKVVSSMYLNNYFSFKHTSLKYCFDVFKILDTKDTHDLKHWIKTQSYMYCNTPIDIVLMVR